MKKSKSSLYRFYSVMLLISVGIAASARPGTPIGGIIVKGGKNPGGQMLLSFSGGTTSPLGGEPAKANINTSRSNIKQQRITGDIGGSTDNPGEPAKANINTSRSNIKQQIITGDIGGSTDNPGEPAKANINTSRSNIKQQIITGDIGGSTDNPGEPAKANINTSRSNIKQQIITGDIGGSTDNPGEPAKANINTSRSNIKQQIITGDIGGSTDNPGEPAKANINTSRSNIKQQIITGDIGGSTDNPGEPAKANINTSRSNIKQQIITGDIGGSTDNPGEPAKANFNTSRSNIKNQISVSTNDSALDSIATAQRVEVRDDFNTTRNNREGAQLVTKPGNPIGGIVVKGGKNPGGQLLTIVADDQGSFELNNLEKGVYEFSLTNLSKAEAQDFNTTRSNRDNRLVTNPQTGDTTTESNSSQSIGQAQDFNTTRNNRERGQLVTKPGTPIGGIIVKGGKNPGGQMKNLVVDDQGNLRFEVMEAGNYKFIIQTPETTDGNNQNAVGDWGDPHENLNN